MQYSLNLNTDGSATDSKRGEVIRSSIISVKETTITFYISS